MFNERRASDIPWMIRLLLKAGFQNQRQAETALLVFVGICVLVTVWMMARGEALPPQNDVQQNPNYEPTR